MWLLYPALIAGFALVLVLAGAAIAGSARRAPLLIFIAVVLLDTLVIATPHAAGLHLGHMNWLGKLASVVFALAVILVLRLDRASTGLIPPPRHTWLFAGVVILLAAVASPLQDYLTGGGHISAGAELYAFEATVPGIDEELFFRGVLYALLLRAIPNPRRLPQWLIPMATTSLLFAAVHGVFLQNGQITTDRENLLAILPWGFVFQFLRLRTGSILPGIIAHNLGNLASIYMAANYGI